MMLPDELMWGRHDVDGSLINREAMLQKSEDSKILIQAIEFCHRIMFGYKKGKEGSKPQEQTQTF